MLETTERQDELARRRALAAVITSWANLKGELAGWEARKRQLDALGDVLKLKQAALRDRAAALGYALDGEKEA